MGTIAIILGVLIIVIIIVDRVYQKSVKKNISERDFMDDNDLDNNSNNTSSRRSSRCSKEESKLNELSSVSINKYHESNEVVGKITKEYWRKYHESEGAYSQIHPSEADDFIMKYVIYIWNEVLDKEATIKDVTLDGVISQAESQFKIWADKVERKKQRINNQISRENSKTPNLIFELKGLSYRSAQAQLEATLLEVGDQLLLEEEPDNEYDVSAVKVLTPSGECIGYVDQEHCVLVGALISRIDNCTIIKKSRHQIPFITVEIKFKDKK